MNFKNGYKMITKKVCILEISCCDVLPIFEIEDVKKIKKDNSILNETILKFLVIRI